jgi:metal-dependent amidase/aminoacylase/carboxypeptidase family protein
MNNILKEAKALQDVIVKDRRYLHQNAEFGHDLPITVAYVLERLRKMGYDPEIICDSAIVALTGVLENPKVDAAAMIHIDIQGKGGHSGMPQNSVDPLNIAAHIHIALQEIIAREVPPSGTTILTIGQMHGGNAANIIPDTAFIEGSVRAFNGAERDFMKTRVK